jgi:hypothetical protein
MSKRITKRLQCAHTVSRIVFLCFSSNLNNSPPRPEAKSVVLTEEGSEKSRELFRQQFGLGEGDAVAAKRPKGRHGREPRPVIAAGNVYQLKITLNDISPQIWRRILVPDVSLGDLHEILQAVMGWRDSHLYQFDFDGVAYTDPKSAVELGMKVADRVRLGALLPKEESRFDYIYDFGDNWMHEIEVEKIVLRGQEPKLPMCLAGKRACPPEDVGGASGYKNLLSVLRNVRHERHRELRVWTGTFDPEAFDLDAVNEAMIHMPASLPES